MRKPSLKLALLPALLIALALPTTLRAEPAVLLAFSKGNTDKVVRALEAGIPICQSVEAVYQFDCYRQTYREAARTLDRRPDYRTAQNALRGVERVLQDVVKAQPDRSRPTIRVAGRKLRPIRPEAVPAATAAFKRARAEAVTQLLRADGKARIHYARIAEVVGSNKVLIRALLRLLPAARAPRIGHA